ncbi:MAG: hypothetical protein H6901_09005 [Rhodobacteraceae bacterium]|nr:hypothetical protein [Paracoccaceae bacterium]MCP5342337.1 hypothetical protein [Paracoccaceae bacterium]
MMSANAPTIQQSAKSSAVKSLIWVVLAVLACLSVLIINGRPLFYFDTIGYISQGHTALRQLGWKSESPLEGRPEAVVEESVGSPSPGLTEIDADNTVDGSRSTVYALLSGALAQLGILEGLIALNVLAVFLAVWMPMRVAARHWPNGPPVAQMVAIPILVAATGSLPFYIAFLMPDTFAPVLLLVLATLTVFARHMRAWEIVFSICLGSLAITSHLSHLAIAVVMLPAAALVSLVMSRRRWWLPPAMILVILGIGFAEQSMLRSAAKAISNSSVVVKPYITARLIQDGPGFQYLRTHCPDDSIPTCKLYRTLMLSSDPYRLTASHIVFETSARLGSFRLMTPEDQKQVADNQIGFFFRVLANDPMGTTLAFLKNTFTQAGWVSVDMTLQTDNMIEQHRGVGGLISGPFAHGRLTKDVDWLKVVTPVQQAVYLASLAVILILLVFGRNVPREIKALSVMLILGILANALVCGGISQPATRYGARVIWLLPLAATIMVMFTRRPRNGAFSAGWH